MIIDQINDLSFERAGQDSRRGSDDGALAPAVDIDRLRNDGAANAKEALRAWNCTSASVHLASVRKELGAYHRDAGGQFVESLLAQTGLLAMIGKAERDPAAIESIRRHGTAYRLPLARRPTRSVRGLRASARRRVRRSGHGGPAASMPRLHGQPPRYL
jgi:hypothetical protein